MSKTTTKTSAPAPDATASAVVPATSAAGTGIVAYDEKTLAILDAGDDYADVGRADVALPFLVVLQALSPQCSIGHADYNPEARPGMISHTITKELLTRAIVTPVAYKRSYIEWVPRKAGGGFRGEYPIDTHEKIFNERRDPETGKALLENGNELIETLTFFVLLNREDGSAEPAIINMALTQTKTARVWNQMQMNFCPIGAPKKQYKRYAGTYALTTEMRRKDQNTWFVWKVLGGTATDPAILGLAQAFEQQVRGNSIVVDYSAAMDGNGGEGAGSANSDSGAL